MALLGFQQRFVAKIEAGEKTHTIRGPRTDICLGSRLDLYAAPRTKRMRLIFRAPCSRIETIEIAGSATIDSVVLAGVSLDGSEIDAFAQRDGFLSFADMCFFWRAHRVLPFKGFVFHWDYSRKRMEK